jgi:hypothetical protein
VEYGKRIGEDIKTVEFGWPVGMPVCKPFGDGIYELRTSPAQNRIARVLFASTREPGWSCSTDSLRKRERHQTRIWSRHEATRASIKGGSDESKKKSQSDRFTAARPSIVFWSKKESAKKSKPSRSSRCWLGNFHRPCNNSKKRNRLWLGSFTRAGHNWIGSLTLRTFSVTLDTITRAARALGKRVIIRVADPKAKRA